MKKPAARQKKSQQRRPRSTRQTATEKAATEKEKVCFLIGPIGKDGSDVRRHADWVLKGLVRPALHPMRVLRADEIADPGEITDQVITRLHRDALAVADISLLNASALYELGIRHVLRLPTVHIAQAGTEIPFDIKDSRMVWFDLGDVDSVETAKAEIAKMAETVLRDDYVVSNPVTAAMSSYELRASGDEKDRVLADLATENAGLRRDYRDMSTRVGHLETEARRNFPSTAFDIAKIIGNDPSSGFKFAIPGEIFKVPEFNLKVSDWLTGTGGVKTEEDDEGEDGK